MASPVAVGETGLRALTVRQPWAHMIARCGKNVENRGRQTHYRGLLAIHAGARSRWDRAAEEDPQCRLAWRRWAMTLPQMIYATPRLQRDAGGIDFGAVVAVAELAGCHGPDHCLGTCSPWAVRGQHHWNLFDVRPLPRPVPCRGMLGLWRLPDDVEKAVRAQLEVEW